MTWAFTRTYNFDKILNQVKYDMCAIIYTLNLSKPHSFVQKLFTLARTKARNRERYDVDVKTYLPKLITSCKETALRVDLI